MNEVKSETKMVLINGETGEVVKEDGSIPFIITNPETGEFEIKAPYVILSFTNIAVRSDKVGVEESN